MTQQEVMQHPFWQKFQMRIGPVINGLAQRGIIGPNESQMIVQTLRSNYPEIHKFIEHLNNNYQELYDNQLDNEIFNWLQPLVQQVKIRMNSMNGGYGVGYNSGLGGGWGGCGRPVGFGFDSFGGRPNNGIPTSPFSGGNPSVRRDTFAATGGGNGGSLGSLLGGSGQSTRDQNIKEQMTPQAKQKIAPPEWKEPTVVGDKPFTVGDVEVLITKFDLSSGDSARRIIIHDPKVGYTSDRDVIERYKSIFSLFPDSRRKMMTVAYQQLKTVAVGRDEFMKLAKIVSVAVNKAPDVENKLRAIIANKSNFNVAAYEEFSRIFLDELEFHIQCGELCDSAHPKNILNRPNAIEDVLAWVTGDINKDMLAAMRGMKGFTDRLNALLGVIIESVVASLPKLIIDTNTDMTMLDDFYRALPGIWTTDCAVTFRTSEDLVNLFLATRETIESSKTASAVKAESVLKTTLDDLGKHFSLIFLPRIVSWCNYSKADVCAYDAKGNCIPSVTSTDQPRNDVEFFLLEALGKWENSRDTRLKWAPRNVYMELDEETYCLQYGHTTDGPLWTGTSRFWHD